MKNGGNLNDAYYIASRDCQYIKIWDSRNSTSPLSKFRINDFISENTMSEMYSNDTIFDRFDLKWSPRGSYLSTGSYNESFQILDFDNQNGTYG